MGYQCTYYVCAQVPDGVASVFGTRSKHHRRIIANQEIILRAAGERRVTDKLRWHSIN